MKSQDVLLRVQRELAQLNFDDEPDFKSILERQHQGLYCTNNITSELESRTLSLLGKCWKFDLRSRESKPLMAKARRRLVFGMHEVCKHASLGKLSAVVIAKDMDENLPPMNVVKLFACSRKQLARLLLVPSARISMVGIFHFDGVEQEWKDLHELVLRLQQKWIDSMIEHKMHVNSFGESVTWLCSRYGHSQVLSSFGGDIPHINLVSPCSGMTSLAVAAKYGHAEVVAILLKVGADQTITDFALNLPIHHASSIEIFDLFAPADKRNAAGNTPLEAAVVRGCLDIVKSHATEYPSLSTHLLYLSCTIKQSDTVQFIAKENKFTKEQLQVALRMAVEHGAYEAFKYIGGLLAWDGVYTEELLAIASDRKHEGIARKLVQLKNRVSTDYKSGQVN